MSRRHAAEKREILPDAKYGDRVLSKFMNNLMIDGKKSVAESIVYGALERMEKRLKREPVQAFHEALDNVKPAVEVRSRRVGGGTRVLVPQGLSRAAAPFAISDLRFPIGCSSPVPSPPVPTSDSLGTPSM